MRLLGIGRRVRAPRQSACTGRLVDPLESRLLLHAGHVHEDESLPEWHQREHELAAASASMVVPPLPTSEFALASDPSVSGQWGEVMQWPGDAIHAAMLPSGKVLFWNSRAETQLWDPQANTITNVANPAFNAFCAGHAFLPDGRLLVVGGHIDYGVGLPNAAVYDSTTDTWTSLPNMNAGRWYPNATTLGSGDVSVSGGTISGYDDFNTLPQVWRADGTGWRDLTSALRAHDYYPHTYLTASGDVYYAGPNKDTFSLDPAGTGSWTEGPQRLLGGRGYGSSVMYDDGKILIAGGSDPPKATAEVIDLNSPNPQWRQVGSMATPRRQMTATILPDGQALVTGGVSGNGFNNRSTPVYSAEMWNPATEQFTTMASMSQPRWYHSTALLLPDGRVLAAGGDDTPTGQVFSPPYLFKGPRPTIAAAPDVITWDQDFTVQTPNAASIANVNLIRMGSVTHAFNYDQRIDKLAFTRTATGLNIAAPAQPNLAPPGYYMLFIVDGNGVPSVAKIMRVGVPSGAVKAPFTGSPATVPGTIEAENFDAGGTWLGWHDTTAGNAGGVYRLGDDVDIYAMLHTSGGNVVGDLAAGEWLEYTIAVPTAAAYLLNTRIAVGPGEGGTYHVEFDGVDTTGPKTVAPSGGQWQDILTPVVLRPGVQVVRVNVDSAGAAGLGRFDRFTLTPAADQPPAVAAPAAATPGVTALGLPVTLSVLGADDAGEANLTYTWTVVAKPAGAANPVFSSNASNASRQIIATFAAVGSYTLRATIADAAGHSVSSDVLVEVVQLAQTTLRAGDDSYVRGGTYADQNFGTDTALVVKRAGDPSSNREAYIRFDLGAISGSAISRATLRLNGSSSIATQSVPISVHGAGNANWSESTITWNTRPQEDPAALGTASVTGGAGDHWYEFDVSGYLRQLQIAGARGVTFVVKATAETEAAIIFKSDEYPGNKSFLVVEHGPAAAPPSAPPPQLIVAPVQLAVPEGSSASFTIRLASQPAADVNVAVSRQPGGDTDLATSLDVPHTFTPDNWNQPQDVLITAAFDADAIAGSATFAVSTPGATTRTVIVTEIDAQQATIETLSLRPDADAYVRAGSYATTNFGSAAQLIVKRSNSTENIRDTYLRFNLTGIGAIESGTLRLYGGLLSSGTGVSVSLYPVSNTSWPESGVTWNSKPAPGSASLGSKTIASVTRQWYEFDVSGYLAQQKSAGATAVSFALRATNVTDPQAAFESDEAAANQPVLVVRHRPGASSPPVPPPPAPGMPVVFRATADAYVRDGLTYGATNFGSATELQLKKNSTGYNRETWLRFDLGSLSVAASAKLRLYGKLAESMAGGIGVSVYSSADTAWAEGGITWNTRPSASTAALASATIAGTSSKWYEWDLTSFVKSELAAGRRVVTLVLRSAIATNAHVTFASDEAAANRPELTITR